uniref:Uncharacterized protein n=1 Tax=Timema bartmani TaxID=61472 RepID=A0A7R9HWI6_9NEOP|nr:unnamed protein product [Timema bartmani]
MTPGPGKTKWNVPASEIARNTNNPIRNIVENLRLDPNPDKPLIALSIGGGEAISLTSPHPTLSMDTRLTEGLPGTLNLVLMRVILFGTNPRKLVSSPFKTQFGGDPTVFGNLLPSPEVLDAVRESLGSLRYNGYAPSVGEWNQPRHDRWAVVSRVSKV